MNNSRPQPPWIKRNNPPRSAFRVNQNKPRRRCFTSSSTCSPSLHHEQRRCSQTCTKSHLQHHLHQRSLPALNNAISPFKKLNSCSGRNDIALISRRSLHNKFELNNEGTQPKSRSVLERSVSYLHTQVFDLTDIMPSCSRPNYFPGKRHKLIPGKSLYGDLFNISAHGSRTDHMTLADISCHTVGHVHKFCVPEKTTAKLISTYSNIKDKQVFNFNRNAFSQSSSGSDPDIQPQSSNPADERSADLYLSDHQSGKSFFSDEIATFVEGVLQVAVRQLRSEADLKHEFGPFFIPVQLSDEFDAMKQDSPQYTRSTEAYVSKGSIGIKGATGHGMLRRISEKVEEQQLATSGISATAAKNNGSVRQAQLLEEELTETNVDHNIADTGAGSPSTAGLPLISQEKQRGVSEEEGVSGSPPFKRRGVWFKNKSYDKDPMISEGEISYANVGEYIESVKNKSLSTLREKANNFKNIVGDTSNQISERGFTYSTVREYIESVEKGALSELEEQLGKEFGRKVKEERGKGAGPKSEDEKAKDMTKWGRDKKKSRLLYRPAKFEIHTRPEDYVPLPPLMTLPCFPRTRLPHRWGVVLPESKEEVYGPKLARCPPLPLFPPEKVQNLSKELATRHYNECLQKWLIMNE